MTKQQETFRSVTVRMVVRALLNKGGTGVRKPSAKVARGIRYAVQENGLAGWLKSRPEPNSEDTMSALCVAVEKALDTGLQSNPVSNWPDTVKESVRAKWTDAYQLVKRAWDANKLASGDVLESIEKNAATILSIYIYVLSQQSVWDIVTQTLAPSDEGAKTEKDWWAALF